MFTVHPGSSVETVFAQARAKAAELRKPVVVLAFHDPKSPALAIATGERRHWSRMRVFRP